MSAHLVADPCVYCGGAPETVDHLVPKSQGGRRGDNLVPACLRCNSAKGSLSLLVFLAGGKHRAQWRTVRNRISAGLAPIDPPVPSAPRFDDSPDRLRRFLQEHARLRRGRRS